MLREYAVKKRINSTRNPLRIILPARLCEPEKLAPASSIWLWSPQACSAEGDPCQISVSFCVRISSSVAECITSTTVSLGTFTDDRIFLNVDKAFFDVSCHIVLRKNMVKVLRIVAQRQA